MAKWPSHEAGFNHDSCQDLSAQVRETLYMTSASSVRIRITRPTVTDSRSPASGSLSAPVAWHPLAATAFPRPSHRKRFPAHNRRPAYTTLRHMRAWHRAPQQHMNAWHRAP